MGRGYSSTTFVGRIYFLGLQMARTKWRNTDLNVCLVLLLARFFSPTSLEWSPWSLFSVKMDAGDP